MMAVNRLMSMRWPDIVLRYWMAVCIRLTCNAVFVGHCFLVDFSCIFLVLLHLYLTVCLSYLLVCLDMLFVLIFSFHCVVRVYFPSECRVSQNSLRSGRPDWCLSSRHVWRICKSCVCVCEWVNEGKSGSGLMSRSPVSPMKPVCF